jgi:hypothetical protein
VPAAAALVFLVLVLLVLIFPSEADGCNAGWESRSPSASSGQALTGLLARFGMTTDFRNLDEESEMTLQALVKLCKGVRKVLTCFWNPDKVYCSVDVPNLQVYC